MGAGTRVYDERREESKGILKETESKRDKIEEFLRTIEERLETLEEEKDELKEYQKYDKMRRALEYQIHDRDLQDARKKLNDMDNKRKNSGEEAGKLRQALQEAGEKAKNANKDVKDLKVKEASAKEERDTLNSELQVQTKEKTKLEFSLKDLRDEVAGDSNSKERAEQELNKLKVTIKEMFEIPQEGNWIPRSCQEEERGDARSLAGHEKEASCLNVYNLVDFQ